MLPWLQQQGRLEVQAAAGSTVHSGSQRQARLQLLHSPPLQRLPGAAAACMRALHPPQSLQLLLCHTGRLQHWLLQLPLRKRLLVLSTSARCRSRQGLLLVVLMQLTGAAGAAAVVQGPATAVTVAAGMVPKAGTSQEQLTAAGTVASRALSV